jgi:hypothetical protein
MKTDHDTVRFSNKQNPQSQRGVPLQYPISTAITLFVLLVLIWYSEKIRAIAFERDM